MIETYFVTLNWNTTDLLIKMIESVEATTPEPHKWVIVDNGSNAANRMQYLAWFQGSYGTIWKGVCRAGDKLALLRSVDWTIAESRENLGCVLGHNAAFDTVHGLVHGEPHQIVMIDTDVVVTENGWLSKAMAWANLHPEVGIVGFEHGPGAVCAPAVFLDKCGNWYLHEPQMQRAEPVEGESVGLGLALIRWPVLEAGLRFDIDYVMYYKQDDDLCFQVRADMGLEAWVYPVGNIHRGSMSLKRNQYKCGDASGWDEFDQIKQANQRHFAAKWAWALEGRRKTMEEEAANLRMMHRRMSERRARLWLVGQRHPCQSS